MSTVLRSVPLPKPTKEVKEELLLESLTNENSWNTHIYPPPPHLSISINFNTCSDLWGHLCTPGVLGWTPYEVIFVVPTYCLCRLNLVEGTVILQ